MTDEFDDDAELVEDLEAPAHAQRGVAGGAAPVIEPVGPVTSGSNVDGERPQPRTRTPADGERNGGAGEIDE